MGAPFGNQNRAKSKRWESALERAIERYPAPADNPDRSDLMKGIDAAADAFVAAMMGNKDLGFFKEFGDRFDGKPGQTIEAHVGGNLGLLLKGADELRAKIRGE